MSNAAFLLAPLAPIPELLPGEPLRVSPHDDAVLAWTGDGPFPEEADYPDPVREQPRRDVALAQLLRYRGATFKRVKSTHGMRYLAHSARADAFDLGRMSGDELDRLRDIAFAFGGDHAVLWTLGRKAHLLSARSAAPGERPRVLELAIRIDTPRDIGRSPEVAERIIRWFAGSPIAPDADALRQALSAPTLDVPAWFAAFGIPGARAVEAPDAAASWAAFEAAADALLAGNAPDPATRKAVNALIDDSDAQLPAKPAAKRGATARRVGDAWRALGEALGAPGSPRLVACAEGGDLYDRITSGPAGDRLLETKRTPLAVSLALGRLLVHYPVDIRRDPIFLALAARDAEVWNGHAFVGPLEELAEGAHGGFTIAIVPAAQEDAFRAAHGVRSDESAARDGWAGEAAIEIRGASGEQQLEAFERWFASVGADGAVIRADRDGSWRLRRFAAGAPADTSPVDGEALARAARDLDPRTAILAAGYPDVLEPGELAATARAVKSKDRPIASRASLARTLKAGAAKRVPSLFDYQWTDSDEGASMLLRLPTTDEDFATSLARDLGATRDGAELWIPLARLDGHIGRVAGDLPPGSLLAVAFPDSIEHLAIDPALARDLPAPPPAPRIPGWEPPTIVRASGDNVYATADFTRFRWSHDDGLTAAAALAKRYPDRVKSGTSWSIVEVLTLHDELLEAAGFRKLGDLLATHLSGIGVRTFAHRDGTTAAIIVMIPGRQLVECELQTVLADGTEVTTSSLDLGQPVKPGASVRRLDAGIAELWTAHALHLAEVQRGRDPRPAPSTLEEFAQLLDA